ncbi:Uma2 family endonuclease [Mucilaginibacter sp. BJC16-A38]|uniref:Uma2 family endonuclease n=1 Tax=Mucilaginibacter phenanthrenivorans TaxID=1234842 RepID=UPI0021579EFB|nr:Uma2 family endonuclease [Mucilaginibacter phenanthrenivorans]MCR8558088.1 Uma2 family endonuclease [Mucilaginibacter phenanthrenivorans]
MQLSDLDINKTYTYADYLKWTFDERLELIKGKIFKMSPAPGSVHQIISAAVSNELYNYLKGKPCKVFSAPFDVRLIRRSTDDKDVTTVVQPDICVICDPKKVDVRGCIGSPDIVVEILSPGNNKKELRNKFEAYEEAGVFEYWIINPTEKNLLQYILIDGRYQAARPFTIDDELTTGILPGFVLSINELFTDQL